MPDSPSAQVDIALRRGTPADLPAIVAIYNHYVAHTAITFDLEPVTVEARQPWLRQFSERGRHQLFVADEAGSVIGFAYSLPLRAKAAYDPSVETTVYLRSDRVGRGLGLRLYRHLFDALAGEDVHRAYACITLPNEASVKLHAKVGYVQVGAWHQVGRKFDRYWDVLWMEKEMTK